MSLRCANRVVLGFIVLLFYPLLLSGPFGSLNPCRKCISREKVTSDLLFSFLVMSNVTFSPLPYLPYSFSFLCLLFATRQRKLSVWLVTRMVRYSICVVFCI